MTLGRMTVLRYLVVWSAIGCAVFSAYVVVVFRTGFVYTAREEDGTLKERISLAGVLNMLGFLLAMMGSRSWPTTSGWDADRPRSAFSPCSC